MKPTLPTDKQARKAVPIQTGVLDYFPRAIAAIAHCSQVGNDQHNPGEPLHWAREKSQDQVDCAQRHGLERGITDDDGVLHATKAAWRQLAALEIELEIRAKGAQKATEEDWAFLAVSIGTAAADRVSAELRAELTHLGVGEGDAGLPQPPARKEPTFAKPLCTALSSDP